MRFDPWRALWSEMQCELPRRVTDERFYGMAIADGDGTDNGLVCPLLPNRSRSDTIDQFAIILWPV